MSYSVPFDIPEIRQIILGYLYPPKTKKGMTIKIIKTRFHPFLRNRISKINNISKYKNKYVITLVNKSCPGSLFWYKTTTYLYSESDTMKVIRY